MLTFLGCAGARLGSQEDLEMSYFLSSRIPDTVSGHKRQVSGQAGWRVDLGLGERGEADLRLGRLCGDTHRMNGRELETRHEPTTWKRGSVGSRLRRKLWGTRGISGPREP